MRIKYLGQSGFTLESEFSTMIIDPSRKEDGDAKGEIVYCTHHHSDHIRGVRTFLEKNNDAILVCNAQVASKFESFNERITVIDSEKTFHKTPWSLRFVEGKHGLAKGVENTGVIISEGEESFGHPGDTINLEGFYHRKVDILAVPIGGVFTASPTRIIDELAHFKEYPRRIVPVHWLLRNPKSFCRRISERFPDIQCTVPEKGRYVF
ncbi:MAG: MBL fold metallo-hydrolase [Candidatus Thorarchaeota archaeon]